MTQDSGKASRAAHGSTAPRARKAGLFVRRMGDELLVYDLAKHKAHRLNGTSARVWKHCNGKTTVSELADGLGGDLSEGDAEALVLHALDQLPKARLLQLANDPVPTTVG